MQKHSLHFGVLWGTKERMTAWRKLQIPRTLQLSGECQEAKSFLRRGKI
jgi:hypothetical protein